MRPSRPPRTEVPTRSPQPAAQVQRTFSIGMVQPPKTPRHRSDSEGKHRRPARPGHHGGQPRRSPRAQRRRERRRDRLLPEDRSRHVVAHDLGRVRGPTSPRWPRASSRRDPARGPASASCRGRATSGHSSTSRRGPRVGSSSRSTRPRRPSRSSGSCRTPEPPAVFVEADHHLQTVNEVRADLLGLTRIFEIEGRAGRTSREGCLRQRRGPRRPSGRPRPHVPRDDHLHLGHDGQTEGCQLNHGNFLDLAENAIEKLGDVVLSNNAATPALPPARSRLRALHRGAVCRGTRADGPLPGHQDAPRGLRRHLPADVHPRGAPHLREDLQLLGGQGLCRRGRARSSSAQRRWRSPTASRSTRAVPASCSAAARDLRQARLRQAARRDGRASATPSPAARRSAPVSGTSTVASA